MKFFRFLLKTFGVAFALIGAYTLWLAFTLTPEDTTGCKVPTLSGKAIEVRL
jgi:hypothetical protein